jgi:opacity protein-like surface antigen
MGASKENNLSKGFLMKKSMAWALAALMAVAAAVPMAAHAGIGGFGTWWDSKDYDNMYGGGAKLALSLVGGFWIEARGSYLTTTDYKSADISLIPLEALVGWELRLCDVIRPYVGAGVGYYLKDFEWKSEWKDWKDEFKSKDCAGYFALAGVNLGLGADISLFGEAKYTLVGEDDKLEWRGSDVKEKYSFDGLSVNVGLKFGF